jgi:hypothetical protein
MPLFWHADLRELLPQAAKGTTRRAPLPGLSLACFSHSWLLPDKLDVVQRKIGQDFAAVKTVLSDAGAKEETFRYYWMLVNSRCYFWNFTKSNKRKRHHDKLNVDDGMALCPFADYFNHSNQGVRLPRAGCLQIQELTCRHSVASNQPKPAVRLLPIEIIVSWTPAMPFLKLPSEQPAVAGEEVTLSYGARNNDCLLVDCKTHIPSLMSRRKRAGSNVPTDGFLLSNNRWDSISVDHLVLPKLSKTQKSVLEEMGYLGLIVHPLPLTSPKLTRLATTPLIARRSAFVPKSPWSEDFCPATAWPSSLKVKTWTSRARES